MATAAGPGVMGRAVLLLCTLGYILAPVCAQHKHPSIRIKNRVEPAGTNAVHPTELVVAASMQPAELVEVSASAEPVTVSVSSEPASVGEDVVPASGEMPAGVLAVTAAQHPCGYKYQQIDLRPVRMQWNSSDGYCGELSVQMVALAKGVWVGQRQARVLSNNNNEDLILDQRHVLNANAFTLLKNKLAFDMPDHYYWDDSNQTVEAFGPDSQDTGIADPPASAFVAWIKRQITAGRPVITALRLDKTDTADSYYDHIVPFFAVCSNNTRPTAPLVNATDAFTMTTNLKDETNRSVLDPGFYAQWKACPYGYGRGEVGCVPSDIYNYGLAVGGLKDPAKLYIKTARLYINGWSNSSISAQEEPGEDSVAVGNSTTARYTLLVFDLTPRQKYRTYRFEGLFPGGALPNTKAALTTACQNKGANCKFVTYTAATKSVVITHTCALGSFKANSVQYFLTVKM